MSEELLQVHGSREGNLKGVSCSLPRGRLVAVTGPSGSGKSSLVFDTIHKEATKRFLGLVEGWKGAVFAHLDSTAVDSVEGLSFSVAVERRPQRSSYATLATYTELYRYMRLLFLHLGEPCCEGCGRILRCHTRQQMVEELLSYPIGSRLSVMAPLGNLSYRRLLAVRDELLRAGYTRLRIDGDWCQAANSCFAEDITHYYTDADDSSSCICEVVVDSFAVKRSSELRLIEALSLALEWGKGVVHVEVIETSGTTAEGELADQVQPAVPLVFSEILKCKQCDCVQDPIKAGEFSYYRSEGRCAFCQGRGCVAYPESEANCPQCGGALVGKKAQLRQLCGRTFAEVFTGSVEQARDWLLGVLTPAVSSGVGDGDQARLLKNCGEQTEKLLDSLISLGLGYLQLNRWLSSLSSGELQRAQLAKELTNQMKGVLYLLDEPSTGLHPVDVQRLLTALRRLIAGGSTVVMIEHELELIRSADFVLDLGPGSGSRGGTVVVSGSLEHLMQSESLTGRYLTQASEQENHRKEGEVRVPRSAVAAQSEEFLSCRKISRNNLQDIDLELPLGRFIAIAGVSGSGKSSLVTQCLVPALQAVFRRRRKGASVDSDGMSLDRGRFAIGSVRGWEKLSFVVDYSEARRVAGGRSIVATMAGVYQPLRQIYARTVEARMQGYSPISFSFNSRKGWCRRCRGLGVERFSGSFVSNLTAPCPECTGKRLNSEVDSVTYRRLSMSDTLGLTIDACADRFRNIPSLASRFDLLREVGLGYLTLDQNASSLSLGEWQRVRLVRELGRKRRGQGLYVFDEPTCGLHSAEVDLLIELFEKLTKQGNTVVVIEHHVGLLSCADYLLELGPGAGESGGQLIAQGSPECLSASATSIIGKYLLV